MPDFTGPLFIVGMPRSGTKLLRDLMNQHPLISIPDVESHFITGFVKKYGHQLTLTTQTEKETFYKDFIDTAFYFNNVNKGRQLSKEDFIKNCDFTDWNSLFRYLVIHFSKNDTRPEIIWGDKTPRYLKSVRLIKTVFPKARFIHIIRDPRDYCLSQRKIWNKNIFRAAVDWKTVMTRAMEYPGLLGNEYMEIYYEELTQNPQKVLTGICTFLGIDFISDMLSVKKSNEFHGDAKGSKEIMLNSKKYLSELTEDEVKKIEGLALPALTHFGYELVHKVTAKNLSKTEEIYYRFTDFWKTYKFYIKDYGIIKASSYVFKLVKNNIVPS